MKLSRLLPILGTCVSLSIAAATPTKEIEAVENGLREKIHFSDTAYWNIEERMLHHKVPGASIAVIKDFKLHWIKSYGLSNRESKTEVTTKTLFQAASISKPISAYGALKLVEEGLLSLDSPVNSQLVGWVIPDNEYSQRVPVALKHLLSHSSGLNVHGFPGYAEGERIPTITQILNGEQPANSSGLSVDFLPGTRFRYSGGGYTVLQKLMSDVTKEPFSQLMQKLVLSPLDMEQSSFEQPLMQEQLAFASTGYYQNHKPVSGNRHTYPELAAAGLWTTPEDLAKFVIDIQKSIHSDSGQVLSKKMASNMLTPSVKEFMGLGMYLMPKKKEVYFIHEGTNRGFESLILAHREKGFGLVIMLNSNSKAFISELKNSISAQYNWDEFLPPVYSSFPITEADALLAAGRYKFQPDVSFQVFSEGARLFVREPLMPKKQLYKIGKNEFISKSNDTKISFLRNEKTGKVEYSVRMPNGKFWGRARLEDNENLPLDLVILGKVEEAEKAYSKFFAERPKFRAPSELGLLQTIDRLEKRGEEKFILPLLKMSTRLYPNGTRSWLALVKYFLEKEDEKKAIQTYEEALKLQPENKQFKQQIDLLREKV